MIHGYPILIFRHHPLPSTADASSPLRTAGCHWCPSTAAFVAFGARQVALCPRKACGLQLHPTAGSLLHGSLGPKHQKTHVFRAMVRFLANGSVTQTRPLEFHLNSNGTFWRLGWTLFSASGKPAGSGSGGIWNLRSSEANYQNDRTPPFFVSLTLLMFLLRNSFLAHGQLGLPGHILLSYILLCSWAFKDKLVPFHGTWLVIWNLHNGLW